jgi:hypothetical protein
MPKKLNEWIKQWIKVERLNDLKLLATTEQRSPAQTSNVWREMGMV